MLKEGTIIIHNTNNSKYKIVSVAKEMDTYWKGQKIHKIFYNVLDLNCTYHDKRQAVKQLTSTHIDRCYHIEGQKPNIVKMNHVQLEKYLNNIKECTLTKEEFTELQNNKNIEAVCLGIDTEGITEYSIDILDKESDIYETLNIYVLPEAEIIKESLTYNRLDNDMMYYKIEAPEGHVCLLLVKINGIWIFEKFSTGTAYNTNYIEGSYNKEFYQKIGRGRESKRAKEYINYLYSVAVARITDREYLQKLIDKGINI